MQEFDSTDRLSSSNSEIEGGEYHSANSEHCQESGGESGTQYKKGGKPGKSE